MNKVIQSWHASAERRMRPALVALDFEGSFTEGSYIGAAFFGRVHFDPATLPSERHFSFAIYDDWSAPIVMMTVGDQVLSAHGAAVYDSIFDGAANHHDFVTMYGAGPFDQAEEGAFFEFYFADGDAATLDGTRMPTARQLCNFPVKQVSFGTNATGDVTSVGHFTLKAAG